MLHNKEEIMCYFSKLNGREPNAITPQFIAYPQGGTFVNGAEVSLSCNVTYASSPTSCPLPVVWEHNGTAIGSSFELVQDEPNVLYHSTLTIPHFSASDQGEYVCRVGNSTDSLASPAAILQLPSKFCGYTMEKLYTTEGQVQYSTLSTVKPQLL